MTKSYELPNGRIFIADIDKSTRICNVTEPQLDILISDLNRYAEMCEHEKEISDKLLDKVRQAREEIRKLDDINPDYPMDRTIHVSRNEVLGILDKLIESEEQDNGNDW